MGRNIILSTNIPVHFITDIAHFRVLTLAILTPAAAAVLSILDYSTEKFVEKEGIKQACRVKILVISHGLSSLHFYQNL